MLDFSFLDIEQIFGENRLKIFKKYGTKAAITDFSILLGSAFDIGCWWTKSRDLGTGGGCVSTVFWDGTKDSVSNNGCDAGARPALPYSLISSKRVKYVNKIKKIEYGEYPQMVADEKTCKELTDQLDNRGLKQTGRFYNIRTTVTSVEERRFTEYEYKGNRYVCFVGNKNNESLILSDGRRVVDRELYWIRVEPIVWLVDKKTNIALSVKILFRGVQFCSKGKYDGNFETTNIKWFMDNYFSKEIVASKEMVTSKDKILVDDENNVLESDDVSTKNIELENPYMFNLDSVTEDNIIRGCIKSSVPVFLHGASSEGKSARVKQIDPKLVKLSLAGITPEKLNGRSVYNSVKDTMEDKKPTWLERLEEICTSEPDENHILFLDELSNALPSIQGMVYHLVLDREVNDRWKLPDNARIVLAGNEMKDSLVANKVVEPLFNRCAHVYIKTDLKDWLIWASQNRIHPSIISFMVYTKGKYLRSKFDGEKPNADPRKWEMVSKILYKAKKPEMIRALVGENIAREFCKFCNQKIISLGDVLNGNYDYNYLSMLDETEKYAIVVELCNVDIDNLEVVRKFLSNLGEGYLTTFDLIYCFDKKEKMDAIVEQYQKVKKI